MIPTMPTLLAFWGLTNSAWIAMWSVLGLLTIVLMCLLRTRWLKNRTWRSCTILSLWVHVLIVVFAMTVRVVVGPPMAGEGRPIRVAVLSEVLPSLVEENPSEEIKPVWDDLDAPALVAPVAEPPKTEDLAEQPTPDAGVMEQITRSLAEAEPLPLDPELAAPELMELSTPSDLENVESDQNLTQAEPNDGNGEEKPLAKKDVDSELPEARTNSGLNRQGVSQKNTEAVPDLYADRFAEDLAKVAARRGGSPQTEAAVKAALGWLAANQSAGGGWDASKFGAGEERVVLGHNRQGAGAEADTAVTGLAILAFLGSGNSHLHGSYRNEVAQALEFLRQHQRSDGSLFGEAELFARTYCHSMASLAACEAYAMTRDERLDPMCRAAVGYTLAMQHPTDGGWRYRRGDTGDTSQLGWVLMALKSAKLAGIEIPDMTWARAERFLRRVKRGTHGGLAAYRPDGPQSRTMTAEAWFCHQLLQTDRESSMNPAAVREAVASLKEELPSAAHRNLYYWYYATLALSQHQHETTEEDESWEAWNHALTAALVATQESDGSWNTDDVWAGYGGRVYTTALSALCLEVYYRYSPVGELAGRQDWQSRQR